MHVLAKLRHLFFQRIWPRRSPFHREQVWACGDVLAWRPALSYEEARASTPSPFKGFIVFCVGGGTKGLLPSQSGYWRTHWLHRWNPVREKSNRCASTRHSLLNGLGRSSGPMFKPLTPQIKPKRGDIKPLDMKQNTFLKARQSLLRPRRITRGNRISRSLQPAIGTSQSHSYQKQRQVLTKSKRTFKACLALPNIYKVWHGWLLWFQAEEEAAQAS